MRLPSVDPVRLFVALGILLALGTAAACDGSSPLLGPDAAQGIEGLVLLGPQCPVQREDEPCPDEPYEADIRILDTDRDRITAVRSGSDGRFRVGLEPGAYILDPVSGDPFPTASAILVEVEPDVFTSVTIHFDTGIR